MKLAPFFLSALIALTAFSAAAKRFALVIGNGGYETASLANPPNDAALTSAALRDAGFAVTTVVDADQMKMKQQIRAFSQTVRSADIDKFAPVLKFFGQSISVIDTRITYGSILMIVLFVVFWYLLRHTAWGREVYAVGDDPQAAEQAGIRTNRVLISVYATAGLICGIAAWSSIGRVGAAGPHGFQEANLESITAVVIGGTSLFGGRGAVLGTLFGALIVGVFSSGLKLAGVDVLWQLLALGLLVIVAAVLDQWIRRISV